MARKKKKQRNVYRKGRSLRYLKPAGVLAGGAVGASVIGSALPAGAGAGLTAAGTGFASMVGPAAVVGGAAIVLQQLKKFPKPKRRKMKGGKR